MENFLNPLAVWLHMLLPEWVRLPNLTFVMPHAMYWLGLIFFPLIAILIIHKNKERNSTKRLPVSNGAAYLLWVWGGFVGLHRFYLKSFLVGLVYIGLFVLLLYGNVYTKKARNEFSDVSNKVKIAKFMVKRHQKSVDRGRDSALPKLNAAKESLKKAEANVETVTLKYDQWRAFSGGMFAFIATLMIIDMLLIPFLVRRRLRIEPEIDTSKEFMVMERGAKRDERASITNPAIRFIEKVSFWTGNFVSYWVVIAVFVYYYEVIARYVFNSPTNWAHESMFLMFGMQYLLTGAYAYHQDSHVRVDVIYEKFSTRTKAKIDLVTSMFFFIFVTTLLVTGFLFAKDSIVVFETSFTEWAIQYWPVKMTIAIGAFLLLLQGFAKLMRDVIYLRQGA